jgi:inorganic triphosphatase YgiF
MGEGNRHEVSALNGETRQIEVELKPVLPRPEDEPAVVDYLIESGYTVERLNPVRNVDTYLDTFDWFLMKKKVALR